jgi:gliding motility-associated-like protein
LLIIRYAIHICLICIIVRIPLPAQNPTCPSPLIYFLGQFNGLYLQVYDPTQPLSGSNPSVTSIPNPSTATSGQPALALMPNISGGTLSPTFYVLPNSGLSYWYWDGTGWINTTHASATGTVTSSTVHRGLGGCSNRLYELTAYNNVVSSATVSVYTGTGAATQLVALNSGVSVIDVATDCNCNFYILDNNSPQNLVMYDQTGSVVCSYSLTSPVAYNTSFVGGINNNGGLAIAGNTVYVQTSPGSIGVGPLYAGILGNSSITFTQVSGYPFNSYDFATCASCNTNSITAVVSSGTINCYTPTASVSTTVNTVLSPVTYSWSGPAIVGTATNAAASVTNSGTYTCVINAGGCPPLQPPTQTIVTVAVSSNTVSPIATVTPTSNICPLPNPQLFSFPNSSGYSSSWSGSGIVSGGNTSSVTVNTGGVYTVVVTNTLNGCADTKTINVIQAPSLTLSASSTSMCAQNLSGSPNSITFTAGGAVNYTLLCSSNFSTAVPNNSIIPVNPTSPFANTVSIATATLLGFDGTCSNTLSSTFSIMPNPVITVANPVETFCYGESRTFTVSGASAYTWSPATFLNTNIGNTVVVTPGPNVVSSVYAVVGSSLGCKSTSHNATVNVLPLPTLTLTPNNPGVCLNTTTITLSALGTATQFTWSPAGINGSSAQNINVAPASVTSYSVIAALNGCTNSAVTTVTVVPPPSLNVSLSSTSICAEAFNGSPNTITLTSTGATTYTLSTPNHISNSNPTGPGSTLSTTPPYNSGMATATIQGSNGVCTVSATANFSIIPNPSISVSSPPFICAGQSYTYTNLGATSYTWLPGSNIVVYSTGSVAVANPSINSVFSVYGGSLGCNSALQTTTLNVTPIPIVNVSPGSPVICSGDKINLIATGAGSGYTWTPFNSLNSNTGATVSASPTTVQTYTVIGSQNSCTNTAIITVSVLPLPNAAASVSKPKACAGETLTLYGAGGDIYEWYFPDGAIYSGQTVTFVPNSSYASGTYTLTVTDKKGCKGYHTIPIIISPLPEGSLAASIMQHCVPFCSDFNYVSVSNTSLVTTKWTLDNKLFSQKNFSYCFTQAGDYVISVQLLDTSTNCINTKTFVVNAYPLPVADFTIVPEKPVESLDEVFFNNTSEGTAQKKWSWFFVNNQSYQSQNENTSYRFMDAGVYPIAMIVTNTWGCTDTVVKAIKIETDLSVYVPNVFSPNGDELNDIFLPITRGVKFYDLSIYDRWGARIFFTTDQLTGWDGSYQGEQCKNDVYTWKIKLSANNGEMKTMTGFVVLSR